MIEKEAIIKKYQVKLRLFLQENIRILPQHLFGQVEDIIGLTDAKQDETQDVFTKLAVSHPRKMADTYRRVKELE